MGLLWNILATYLMQLPGLASVGLAIVQTKRKNHALSGYSMVIMRLIKLYSVYAGCSIPFMVV